MRNIDGIRKRIIKTILFLLFLLLISIFYLNISHYKWFFIPCIFYEITGFYCPGCGMTRALYSFFTLNFGECFRNNLLLLFLLPAFLYYLFCSVKNYLLTGKIVSLSSVFPKWVFFVGLVLVIIYGIFRNFEFFTWMQPI